MMTEDLINLFWNIFRSLLVEDMVTPSRPWNRFSIDIKDSENEKLLSYQGNWRDLFQNWEALALSYPEYIGEYDQLNFSMLPQPTDTIHTALLEMVLIGKRPKPICHGRTLVIGGIIKLYIF